MASTTTGNSNVAIGTFNGSTLPPLYYNTTGYQNVAIGTGALRSNTTANNSVAIGFLALTDSTTASVNVAVGSNAGSNTTTGQNNTYIGYGAGRTGTTNGNNTALGYAALGYNASFTGTGNMGIGVQSGYNLTTGVDNAFVGAVNSGFQMTTGSKNVILGSHNGNSDGLDIRTSNSQVVISDGDGYVQAHFNSGKLKRVRFQVNSDYSNTYDYVAAGAFGTTYADLIPTGNLVAGAIYLVTINCNYGVNPYYQDVAFIFKCVNTNGVGAGSPIEFMASHHVNRPAGLWNIRVSTASSSTNGLQGLASSGPGTDAAASITVYAQRIS